jgi:hypothetical protein
VINVLFAFFPDRLSLSESPFSLPVVKGAGLDLSLVPVVIRALAAAFLAAPRRVEPPIPRHEAICGANRFDAVLNISDHDRRVLKRDILSDDKRDNQKKHSHSHQFSHLHCLSLYFLLSLFPALQSIRLIAHLPNAMWIPGRGLGRMRMR